LVRYFPSNNPGLPSSSAACIVVLGPTGSGKSDLALSIAGAVGGEIINFDSVQVYRHLDVGSAKVPLHQRRDIPHHLLDIIEPTEEMTAGSYARAARAVLAELEQRQKPAILVGGTGFYLRALLSGLSPAPPRNEPLRRRLDLVAKRRPGALHRFLRTVDPLAAERIHRNDLQKVIRAIELAGSTVFDSPREGLQGKPVLKLGLNPERKALYKRLNERCIQLFEHGLLRETSDLIARGIAPTSKVFSILGYRQAQQVLTGAVNRTEALLEYQTKTRQYAKRQMTWFRAEEGIDWLPGFGFEPEIEAAALEKARTFVRLQNAEAGGDRC
jgi:tRNA dimethylallyltransferase